VGNNFTWNDFEEGTIIEPTQEFEYKYLEMTQNIRKNNNDSLFEYTSEHLRIPYRLYLLKKKYKNNSILSQKLDKASDLLFTDKIQEGQRIIEQISSGTD
jgi:glycoprotein endo-alpha-1,2-mannosidase